MNFEIIDKEELKSLIHKNALIIFEKERHMRWYQFLNDYDCIVDFMKKEYAIFYVSPSLKNRHNKRKIELKFFLNQFNDIVDILEKPKWRCSERDTWFDFRFSVKAICLFVKETVAFDERHIT